MFFVQGYFRQERGDTAMPPSRRQNAKSTISLCSMYTLIALENKILSYRRETALQGALWCWPKLKDWNWETILYGHYRSIFNHCNIIGRQICRIRLKTQNKGYYGVQGHRGRYQSKALCSMYVLIARELLSPLFLHVGFQFTSPGLAHSSPLEGARP